jgi:hypothetical protein
MLDDLHPPGKVHPMKDKLSSLVGILLVAAIFFGLGPGCAYYGIHKLVAGPDKEVTCGGQVMHSGDICRETRNGSSVGASSYTEQRNSQNSTMNRTVMPIISAVIGAGVTLVGLFVLWQLITSRRGKPQTPEGP